MTKFLLTGALICGFVAGVVAQRASSGVNMRGIVLDANTIAEEIEYWEVRTPEGESIVITGRSDLPVIRWLRLARNRPAVITLEPGAAAAPARLP